MAVRAKVGAFAALAAGLLLWAALAVAQTYSGASVTGLNGAGNSAGLLYASNTPTTVNSATPTSVFPAGSAAARTFPSKTMTTGREFGLLGGGVFSVPTGNLLAADIKLYVGSTLVVAVTTPAAPVGTNAGIDFHAECVVNTSTTIICTGVFTFAVLGTTPVIVPFNSISAVTFDPTVANTIDVTGDWNGTVTTQSTTVQTAILMVRN